MPTYSPLVGLIAVLVNSAYLFLESKALALSGISFKRTQAPVESSKLIF